MTCFTIKWVRGGNRNGITQKAPIKVKLGKRTFLERLDILRCKRDSNAMNLRLIVQRLLAFERSHHYSLLESGLNSEIQKIILKSEITSKF